MIDWNEQAKKEAEGLRIVFKSVPISKETPTAFESECQICKKRMGKWDRPEHIEEHKIDVALGVAQKEMERRLERFLCKEEKCEYYDKEASDNCKAPYTNPPISCLKSHLITERLEVERLKKEKDKLMGECNSRILKIDKLLAEKKQIFKEISEGGVISTVNNNKVFRERFEKIRERYKK